MGAGLLKLRYDRDHEPLRLREGDRKRPSRQLYG